jgi:hypothetical protein
MRIFSSDAEVKVLVDAFSKAGFWDVANLTKRMKTKTAITGIR